MRGCALRLVLGNMGCAQSEPYVPDGAPIEAIAFHRKSRKHAGKASKKNRGDPQPPHLPDQALAEAASLDTPPNPHKKSSPGLFKSRLKRGNELSLSVEALEAVDLELKEKKLVQKRSLFPVWKTHETCTFCVSDSKDEVDVQEMIVKVTHMDPADRRLCRQCSSSMLTSVQNNLRGGSHSKGVNVAIAKFLAMTALDLTAPASDALLKNRKNAWIQVAGHPGSFAPAGPNTIWKKRMEKENYETKTYTALMGEPLRDMVPTFHREVHYNAEFFIEMEDLLQHFSDPNIMDIKMGKRTFLELEVKNPVLRKDLYEKMVTIDPDAPSEEERQQEAITKLRYMQFREQESSTADLGFRIEAIRMSGEPPNTNLKKTKQKQQVAEVILEFFKQQLSSLKSLLARLIDIRDKFEKSEFFKGHEIIGSSLLIMYDAEICSAWMIDFAKTIPVDSELTLDHRSPWRIGNHEDGYLSGLDNLIWIVEKILEGELGQKQSTVDDNS